MSRIFTVMHLIRKFIYSFFLLFPAFLAIGKSQLPLWPLLLFTSIQKYRVKLDSVIILLSILILCLVMFFFQTVSVPATLANNLYYMKQLSVVVLALVISRHIDLHSMHFAWFIVCIFSIIIGLFEFFVPGLCNSFVYVNATRPCSGMRVSAFYNEPSHIAFLFFTFYVYMSVLAWTKWSYVILIPSCILFFSMTHITLISFIFIYRLFRQRSGAFVFLILFIFYSFVAFAYLFLREYGYLPVQQSWDKRNLFYVNSFFDVDFLLIYPFFGERQFLYDGWFQALSNDNFEIAQIATGDIVYSLSLLGGLVWSVGPIIVFYLILKLRRSPSIFGLSIGALLLGFPVSLFVLVALFSVDRFPNFIERNNSYGESNQRKREFS